MTFYCQFMASDDPIHDAIYGGPLPEAALRDAMKRRQLDWPVRVCVAPDHVAQLKARWVYQPGDGLAYLTDAGASSRTGWRTARSPAEWQQALQQCILDLRRQALAGHMQEVSPHELEQLRRLALNHFRAEEDDLRAAVQCWADATLVRHTRKIHDAQRALLAFALEAGEPLETIGAVGHRHHHALEQLLGAYTGDGLRRWLLETLLIVHEQLGLQRSQPDETIRRALDFIEANLTRDFTLDDVAEAVAMTPAALSRKFKAALGGPFSTHVQSQRLERAIPLLLTTRRTVLDIALDCGFGSVEQFHRVFKQRLGTTPLAYRRGRSR